MNETLVWPFKSTSASFIFYLFIYYGLLKISVLQIKMVLTSKSVNNFVVCENSDTLMWYCLSSGCSGIMGHKQGHVTEHMELSGYWASELRSSSCVSWVSSIVKTSCLPFRIKVAFLHFVYVSVTCNSPNNVYKEVEGGGGSNLAGTQHKSLANSRFSLDTLCIPNLFIHNSVSPINKVNHYWYIY